MAQNFGRGKLANLLQKHFANHNINYLAPLTKSQRYSHVTGDSSRSYSILNSLADGQAFYDHVITMNHVINKTGHVSLKCFSKSLTSARAARFIPLMQLTRANKA